MLLIVFYPVCRTYLPTGLVGSIVDGSSPTNLALLPGQPSQIPMTIVTAIYTNFVPGINSFLAIYKVRLSKICKNMCRNTLHMF